MLRGKPRTLKFLVFLIDKIMPNGIYSNQRH
nr:MAG TPA: hypothetical protein [Caudoviricetes sp.]